ncbi:ATP-binding protein [Kitasatospora aureofaciens]|uniref:ATP-binding protein n=1 Tax=Kitasatospora aureofaciens TaxID=1894 RepID=UPI003409AA77
MISVLLLLTVGVGDGGGGGRRAHRSELVGNAAKTGCQRKMTVSVERITDRCVRISVRDGSRVLPCLIDAGPAAESGRGMALVRHLTGGHWGVIPEPYGKTVHADLRTHSAEAS